MLLPVPLSGIVVHAHRIPDSYRPYHTNGGFTGRLSQDASLVGTVFRVVAYARREGVTSIRFLLCCVCVSSPPVVQGICVNVWVCVAGWQLCKHCLGDPGFSWCGPSMNRAKQSKQVSFSFGVTLRVMICPIKTWLISLLFSATPYIIG